METMGSNPPEGEASTLKASSFSTAERPCRMHGLGPEKSMRAAPRMARTICLTGSDQRKQIIGVLPSYRAILPHALGHCTSGAGVQW